MVFASTAITMHLDFRLFAGISVRMRLFSNVPLILLLVVTWPIILLGLVVACEWLERRTLAPKAIVPRRMRRMKRAEPEQVEEMVLRETAHVVARYWAATGESSPGHHHNDRVRSEVEVQRSAARPR